MLLAGLSGCGADSQPSAWQGHSRLRAPSLGEAVYEAVCSRVAQGQPGAQQDVSGAVTEPVCRGLQPPPVDASPAWLTLHAERSAFIGAIDDAVGPEHQDGLKTLLGALLPLHDDGTLRRLAAAAAAAARGLAQDEQALAGLARLAERQGYQPGETSLLSALVAGPEMARLLPALLAAVQAQPQAWQALQAALLPPWDGPGAQLVLGALQDLSGWIEPLWVPVDSAAQEPPAMLVRRDASGRAMRAQSFDANSTGQRALPELLPPFALPGVAEALPRGSRAVARGADGLPMYLYRATGNTLLAQATTFAGAYLQAQADAPAAGRGGPLQRLLRAARPAQLEAQAEALDVILRRLWPERAALAALGHRLLTQHEPLVVEAARAFVVATQNTAALVPAAGNSGHSASDALLMDLSGWLSQLVARPQLVADVLAALAQPDSARLAPALAAEMAHVDAIDFDPLNVNGPAVGRLVTPTGPQQPQSTFARLLDLVQGARGARLCSAALEEPMPQYDRCALFEVPCAATFYLNSLAHTAELTLNIADDDFFFPDQFAGALEDVPGKSEMEAFTGIDGFERVLGVNPGDGASNVLTFNVSPKAASRLLFALHDARVPPDSAFGRSRAGVQLVTPRLLTASGEPFDEVFRGTVFAWEAEDFARGVQPVVAAFVAHGAQGMLLDLLAVLQAHWPALLAEDPQFERRVAQLLGDVRLVQAVLALLPVVVQDGTQPWTAAVAAVVAPDGSGSSPAVRLLQIADSIQEALPASNGLPLWARAFLGPADGLPGNLHLRPVLRAWLDAAQQSHAAKPWPEHFSLNAWLHAPILRPLATLMAAALRDIDTQQAALQLGARLLDGDTAAGLIALADAAQLAPDAPQLLALGSACAQHASAPDPLLPQAVAVAQRLFGPTGLEPSGRALALMQRLLSVPATAADEPPNGSPITTLWRIGQRFARRDSATTGPLKAPDMARALAALADFMDDDQHGLVRLFDLIAARHGTVLPAGGAP